MARIDSFLRLVVEQRASDLHFTAGAVPLIRHNGELLPLPFRPLTETEARKFLSEILTPEEREKFEAEQELDMLYSLQGVGRFRANIFMQNAGWGAAFRIIPDQPPQLDELKFPPVMQNFCALKNGLVLIGGPTGSGKTTTLAAIVNEINKTQRRHIITLEDPIEFLHEPIQSAITQRQIGTHVGTFAEALRSALRESPDVLVIGEMRDAETLHLAMQAAETGVLVFATLHTSSASKTIHRLIDMAEEDLREQVRSSLSVLLRGVIAQHLLRANNGDGRVAVLEILMNNSAVSSMIRENKIPQIDSYLQSPPSESGMQSLDACLMRHLNDGELTVDEACRVAGSPDVLRKEVARMMQESVV